MHFCRPWRKHVQSFKKTGIILYEELWSQGTHCLNIHKNKKKKKKKKKPNDNKVEKSDKN